MLAEILSGITLLGLLGVGWKLFGVGRTAGSLETILRQVVKDVDLLKTEGKECSKDRRKLEGRLIEATGHAESAKDRVAEALAAVEKLRSEK